MNKSLKNVKVSDFSKYIVCKPWDYKNQKIWFLPVCWVENAVIYFL